MRIVPVGIFLSVALMAGLTLVACGGNGSMSGGGTTTTSNNSTSPAVISAGDAPMSSVLSAMVTISAVTFTNSSGGTVQLLSQPRKLELAQLGGIRAPLELDELPFGTYTNLALTVTAAQITYLDSNNNPVTTNATIGGNGTGSIALSPNLVVNDTGATDVRFDFDLTQSLDLTGSTVTFTPSISAAVARVAGEGPSARLIHINGVVTATSVANNTITLQTMDSGLTVTLNVNGNTLFDDNLTLATLQVGAALHTQDNINADGSLTALLVEDSNGGQPVIANTRTDAGIVVATTRDANNNLQSFTMVSRDSILLANIGQMVTVNIVSGTTYKDSKEATEAGLATFDQTQIFPGQGVWVNGSIQTAKSMTAAQIRPAAVNPFGLLLAVPTSTATGLSISLFLDGNTDFAHFSGIGTLNVLTNSNTVFDGSGLTAGNAANMTANTPLTMHGFISLGGTTYTGYAAVLTEEGHKF